MVSKEAYVLTRVKHYVTMKTNEQARICPETLQELMAQWAFDYAAEKAYRPDILNE